MEAYNRGGGTVFFPRGDYIVKRKIPTDQKTPAILLLPNVSIDADPGTRIYLQHNCSIIGTGIPNFIVNEEIVANVVYGDTTLTVTNTSDFKVGDVVVLRIGDNPWDNAETCYADIVEIKAIVGSTLTLDRPILINMNVAATTAKNKRVQRLDRQIEGISIRNLTLINDISKGGNAESGIDIRYGRNITIENIEGENPGSGVVMLAYSTNVSGRNIGCNHSIQQNKQGSKGRIFNLWNCNNCKFEDVYGADFEGCWLFAESFCRAIQFKNGHIVNNSPTRNNTTTGLFIIVQGSQVDFENFTIDGNGGFSVADQGATVGSNICTFRHLNLRVKDGIKGGLFTSRVTGILRMYQPFISREVSYNMDATIERVITIPITASMYRNFLLPAGIWKSVSVEGSSNLSATDVTSLYIGRENHNGANHKTTLDSSIGVEIFVPKQIGTDYNVEFRSTDKTKVLISTPSNVGEGRTVTVRFVLCPELI